MTGLWFNVLILSRNRLKGVGRVLSLAIIGVVFQFGERVDAAPPEIAPAMIDQLKRLSRAEQEELAAQYGIDLASLGGTEAVSESLDTRIGSPREPLEPVKTVIVTEPSRKSTQRYGTHLFDTDVSTFAPVDNFPVPAGYLMGPGDTLNIMLFGKEQSQYVLQIDREGAINFPRLGAISLTGLSFREAKQMVEQRIARQMIGTEVIVSMGRLRSIGVFLAGEVRTPGTFSISALSTLTQALYVAGGITDIGSLRNIQVRRDGLLINTFDVYDLMLRGESGGDIRLQSGDVLFVPTVGPLVTIEGAVLRPAEYELRGFQTLGEVLEMAGGVVSLGYRRLVKLERYSSDDDLPKIIAVDLTNEEQKNIGMQDGDTITVDWVASRRANPVELIGALARPNTYGWFEGARFTDYVADVEADLLPETDLEIGLIVRRINADLDIDVSPFVVAAALENPGGPLDPEIRPHDQVVLFELPNLEHGDVDEDVDEDESGSRGTLLSPIIAKLRSQAGIDQAVKIVGIGGAVKEPGEYPLLRGGSIESLIKLAGGLKGNAYTMDVEVRRINSVPGNSAQIQLINSSLTEAIKRGSQTKLQSRDFVRINYVRDWNPADRITVEGEVMFPGEYLITPGETLKSILDRAGGLTHNAFPDGALFTRLSVKAAERQRITELSSSILRSQAVQLITAEERSGVVSGLRRGDADIQTGSLEALAAIETAGRLVIDMPGIISGENDKDIVVQDGDVLSVPVRTNAVSVVGEVNRPGSFRYLEELHFDNYIKLAAGTTARSNTRAIYVIKANGLVRKPNMRKGFRGPGIFPAGYRPIQLQEGDTIVVPINEKYRLPISRYRDITTVVFQSIVSIATLLAL